MEKLITEQMFYGSKEERAVPTGTVRLTQGPIDALRFSGGQGATQAVVFFHGNTGNITWYTDRAQSLQKTFPGHDVWVFEYVGFGRLSQTSPNTERLVLGAYQFLSAVQKYYKSWTWVAESIGAPIALGVLTKLDDKSKLALLPSDILLVNTFASIGSMSDLKKPGSSMWVKKLGYELNTAKYARQVVDKYGGAVRLHAMRAKGVTEVPVDQMVQVAEAARVPLEVIEGGNQDYVLVVGGAV